MAGKAGNYIYRIVAMLLVATMLTTSITPFSYASERPETLPQGEPICGFTEHMHTQELCYKEVQNLICALEETEGHSHTKKCYDTEKILVCDLDEGTADNTSGSDLDFVRFTEGTSTESNLFLTGHKHTGACYERQETLICNEPEQKAHVHMEQCYTTESMLQCILPIHIHTESCYAEEEELALVQQTLTTTGSSVSVSGILPEGAALAVRDLTDDEYEALPVALDTLLFAYDITILVDGVEYQPETPVTVSVVPQAMTYSLRESMPSITVHHVTGVDANGEMNVETVARDAMNDEGTVTFMADSFSVYYGVMQAAEEWITLTNAGGTLTEGKYRLESDVKLNTKITIANNAQVTIDLNGYMLEGTGSTHVIENQGKLTIIDSNPNGGPHYFQKKTADDRMPWKLLPEDTGEDDCVAIRGGIITGGWDKSTSSGRGGGAIYQPSNNTSKVTYLNGGTIVGNRADRAGGGAYGGTIYMNGATVKGNYAKQFAGAISLSGNLVMYDGLIEDNYTNPDSSYNIESNKYDDTKLFHDNASIIFGGQSGFVMTGGILRGNLSTVSYTDNAAKLKFEFSGGELYGNVRLLNRLSAYISGGVVNGSFFLRDGSCTVSGDALIQNGVDTLGGGVYIKGGSFTMTGGTIRNCEATEYGGAFYLKGGSATINGGTISGNKAKYDGGGAYLEGGTLIVTGGSFANNTAGSNGGGAYLNGGDFKFGDSTSVQTENLAAFIGNKAQNGAAVYLTGGEPYLYQGVLSGNIANANGGGIYIDEKELLLNPVGTVTIANNKAVNGAGIYIHDGDTTNTKLAGFSVIVEAEGNVVMQENNALAEGGGVCINNGYFTLDSDKITLLKNHAQSGGAVAVLSGDFNMSNGAIGAEGNGNTAENGGAVYVAGGDVNVTGGKIHYNTANKDGGGIYVKNGNYTQVGGNIDNNTATTGKGGGVFASANTTNVEAKVLSGTVSDNTAGTHGGAIAVVGNNSATVNVTIGVNEPHFDVGGTKIDCEHDTVDLVKADVLDCPVVSNNKVTSTTNSGGGAVYVTEGNGSAEKTLLYIYCLTAANNDVATDDDAVDSLSDFMLVEGGTVQVSTNPTEQDQTATHGCINITGNMYVVGGKVDLWGNTKNPKVNGIITVDIADSEEYCNDHRVVEGLYTVTYYENMGDETTRYNSYPIFVDSSSSTAVTLKSNIFTRPGYELLGWHTSSNAQPDQVAHTSGDWNTDAWYEGWYDMNSTHTFGQANEQHERNLELYAIWRANGYTVQFDANVPSGISYENNYSNQDATQTLNYGVEANLISNQYFYPGHIFTGWNTKADGSGDSYGNEQVVKNLAQKGTITLYAQWKPCIHDNSCIFTYTVNGATLTKTCSCKAYSESITISAENATYDGNPHGATLSSDTWGLPPQYKKGGDELSGAPVDAGTYTASITAGGVTASVTYTINKATQPAPGKPIFEVVNSTLTVDEITPPEAPGSVPMYQLVYYTGGAEGKSTAQETREFTLDQAYTSYYVQVWYSEGTNHLASDVVKSKQTHYFTGDVIIDVVCETGIDYQLIENTGVGANGLSLDIRAEEGYYLNDLNVTANNNEITINPDSVESGWQASYDITGIPNPAVIIVYISGAEKGVSIDAKVVENQVFGEVVGDTVANVTNGSSYTAYFDVKDYDSEVYSGLSVKFSSVPSKVILLDKSDNSYWYCNEPSSMIALSSFIRMGTETVEYNVSGTQLKLQFIVDGVTAETTTTLVAAPKAGKNAPEQDRSVTTYVDTATFELSTTNNGTLTQTITHTYTVATDYTDTRYDHRHGALVLSEKTGTTLPADARISVTIGNAEAIYYKNGSNRFVIPLGDIASGEANITLVSAFLPDSGASYTLTAQWIASDSIADLAPAKGGELAAPEDIIFTSAAKEVPAINISSENRLATAGTDYSVTIEYGNIPPNAEAYITLYRKTDTGGFAPAGAAQIVELPATTNDITYTAAIPWDRTGSAYLHLELKAGLDVIKEIDYHFIIQNPSTTNPDGSSSTTV